MPQNRDRVATRKPPRNWGLFFVFTHQFGVYISTNVKKGAYVTIRADRCIYFRLLVT